MKSSHVLFRSVPITCKLTSTPLFLLGIVLLLLLQSSCINRKKVIASGSDADSIEESAARAESIFGESPREYERVLQAFELMSQAATLSSNQNPRRFELLTRAAWFAIWIAYYGDESEQKAKYAEQAMVLCNTAIQINSERVEGYYIRSIATGLFAQERHLFGRDAMGKMKEDALKAIEIDSEHDNGGPNRVLGALYLRAPGPPAGIGSPRRAVHYFEESLNIIPDHPETHLFLIEAYIKLRNKKEVSRRLEEFRIDPKYGDDTDRNHWNQRYQAFRRRLEKMK